MFNSKAIALSDEERVQMATRCRDADSVPKVEGAGQLFDDPVHGRFQLMHNGLKVVADGYYGAWMTDLIRLCRGHHESQEERMFHEIVSRMPADGTMIELGGFWSYYSLWYLRGGGERRAYVIEPDPVHLAVGQANAALNGLSPTFLHGFAGSQFALGVPFHTEKSGLLSIPAYSVEHLMDSFGIDRLSMLHCDVQGAETIVLESSRHLLRDRRIDWVFVSTHAHQISGDPLTHQKCLAILRDCGATIEVEHDVHESFSGDGLIVARFCEAPEGWESISLSYNRHDTSLFRHLAYDLADAQRKIADLEAAARDRADKPEAVLERRGYLFETMADCSVAAKGEALMIPEDQVMMPQIVRGSWQQEEIDFVASTIDPDLDYTLIDIGANVGMFTRQLLRRAANISRVLCVEPDSQNFLALRYNLEGVGKSRTEFFNVALGSLAGSTSFYRDRQNIGNYSLNHDAMRGRAFDEVTVNVVSTSGWMAENADKGDSPIIWKSDTQGFDELIISLTPWTVWKRIEVAIVEMWRIDKPDFDRAEFLARLADFPHRRLGDRDQVSVDDIATYLDASDWEFEDLYLWR